MIKLDISGILEKDRTPVLLAAIDLVEHILLKPNIASAFTDQDDVGRNVSEKATVIDVVNHFREHRPKILVGEAESYAWTGTGQHPSITIKKEIIHAEYRNAIEFARYAAFPLSFKSLLKSRIGWSLSLWLRYSTSLVIGKSVSKVHWISLPKSSNGKKESKLNQVLLSESFRSSPLPAHYCR